MCRKKKEKGSTDLSAETKTKCATDGDQVVAEDGQKDAQSDAEVLLLNR